MSATRTHLQGTLPERDLQQDYQKAMGSILHACITGQMIAILHALMKSCSGMQYCRTWGSATSCLGSAEPRDMQQDMQRAKAAMNAARLHLLGRLLERDLQQGYQRAMVKRMGLILCTYSPRYMGCHVARSNQLPGWHTCIAEHRCSTFPSWEFYNKDMQQSTL